MNAKRLRAANFGPWIESLRTAGLRVVGPVRAGTGTLFAPVSKASDIVLDGALPRKSVKGVFFPQSEVILQCHLERGTVKLEDVEGFAPPTVALGVRPCDAAALGVLDAVFNWDYKDTFYNQRRESTTVIALGCAEPMDEACFCSSLGLGPDSREGADVFALREASGDLRFEACTAKGEALLNRTASLLEEDAPLPPPGTAQVPRRFDGAVIKPWLDGHFDDDFWKEMSLKCMGCGACSFLCPTCHCFDIVDETCGEDCARRRNWDSCQFGQFTVHASGHNPRNVQSERCRQRVMHKFKYYVEKFGETLCVGCGRCVRACPVGQSLLDFMTEIEKRARTEGITVGAGS